MRWIFFAFLFGSFALLWQNCGNVMLQVNTVEVPLGAASSQESRPTPFRLPDPPDYNMRVAFIVDVSASMQTKGCSGTGADADRGVCTDGNMGYDPYFHRLRMIENWIRQIDDYLIARGLPLSRLEMAFFPFSMSDAAGDPMAVNGSIRIGNTIDVHLNQKAFTSDRAAILRILDSYRKMYFAMYPDGPPVASRLDPAWGFPALENATHWRDAATRFIKTSIPGPTIDRAKDSIIAEINQIRNQTPSLLSQTRFEVVFLSDGVAKPHHDDLRQAFELLWQARKIYRDFAEDHQFRYSEHCSGRYSCAFVRRDFSQSGLNCSANCRKDIDFLIRNGRRSFEESELCRQCVYSVLDYMATPEHSNNGPAQMVSFLDEARVQWGNHEYNYAVNIQRKLNALENVFKQNPEVQYRFNFVRFDSEAMHLKTPPLLLTVERNWLEQSKVKFQGHHRHAVITNYRLPFSLFPGQSEINGYKLSQFFVVNPHARINSIGVVTLDSDADGLFDHEEDFLGPQFDKTKSRSNGVCLDVIVFRSGSCVQTGCDPSIDRDGDGLNECEEASLQTSDLDFDSDRDGISDFLEMVYGFNPILDDRSQDNNGDGVSNYVNFTVGAGPWTEISDLGPHKKVQFTVREAEPVPVIVGGQRAMVPTYAFRMVHLPTIDNLAAVGGIDTYFNIAKRPEHLNVPPFLARDFAASRNRVHLMGRVDHTQNIGDIFWVYKPLEVPFSLTPLNLQIELQDLQVMPWLDPDSGVRN
jgi:hypothetical protein